MNQQKFVFTEGLEGCSLYTAKYWLEFWQALALFSVLLAVIIVVPVSNAFAFIGVLMFLFARLIYPLGKISKNHILRKLSWLIGTIGILIFLDSMLTNYSSENINNPCASLIHSLAQHYLSY